MLSANKYMILLGMMFLQMTSLYSMDRAQMDIAYDEEYRMFCADKNTEAIVTRLKSGMLPNSRAVRLVVFEYIKNIQDMECIRIIESNDELYKVWIASYTEKYASRPSKHYTKLKGNLTKLQTSLKKLKDSQRAKENLIPNVIE